MQTQSQSTVGKLLDLTGSFVILWLLWHFIVMPYLIVTAIICAIPAGIAYAITTHDVADTMTQVTNWPVVLALFGAGFIVWCRYFVYKWLFRKFIKPVDRLLSDKPQSSAIIEGTAR